MKRFLEGMSEKSKKYLTLGAVVGLMLFMFLVAFFSSNGGFGQPGDSGTVDEVAHIPSGYSYIKYLDYRLNPEHPPLAKALAGIPLALNSSIQGPNKDWSWESINQWEAGWYMIYEAGNDPAKVLLWARLPMMLLMIGLGLFVFKWAKELWGRKVGLIVLLLFALYPDVIAHGRLVTTDIAAAFGFVITMYYFDRALRLPSKKSTIIAAVAFGIAQLLKFSSILLLGIMLLMVLIRAYLDMDKEKKFEFYLQNVWKSFKIYFWTCFLSLILVWIFYIPFVWNTPVDIEHKLIETNLTNDPKTLFLRNFLHGFEGNPITRGLGHYLLGIMLVFARVAGGNAVYIMGHMSDKSISWFFPVAWLIKTPITIIILFLSSFVLFFSQKKKSSDKIWTFLLFLLPWFVYWAFTLKGSLNIGIRHLMPTVPFVLLMIGYLINWMLQQKNKIIYYALPVLIAFMAVSTLRYYPNFIAYFNESVPKDERYKYMTDSSLDWGQDLLRLKKYVEDNNITDLKVDYFGGSQPSYYLPKSSQWRSSYGPTTGHLAVSATFYQSSKLYGEKEGKWSYGWLDKMEPEAIIGGSILLFDIKEEDLRKNPPTSSYPIKIMEYPASIN